MFAPSGLRMLANGMNRRHLLVGGVASCVCCRLVTSAMANEAPHAGQPHWAYEGEAGAAHWGQLSPAFRSCELGLQQSPLDLTGGITAELRGDMAIDYRPSTPRIINNGHTIQINTQPGSACVIGGTRYELLQFHFHHPSEHLLSGKPFDLECHFVHRSATGDLAVIGVFLKPGQDNIALQPIWDAMPREAGPERSVGRSIDPSALLPERRDFFRYMGSLTTPPCSEGIAWTVFRDAIDASPQQIRQFATLFSNNARPVQQRNRRYLLRTS